MRAVTVVPGTKGSVRLEEVDEPGHREPAAKGTHFAVVRGVLPARRLPPGRGVCHASNCRSVLAPNVRRSLFSSLGVHDPGRAGPGR